MKYGFKNWGCIISSNFLTKLEVILYTVPAKRYFKNKILNTKYRKCSKRNHSLLTLHSADVVVLKTKTFDVPLWPQENHKVPLWQVRLTGCSKDTLARKKKKKKNPAEVQTWNCSSHQRVYFHECLPAACYNFPSQALTNMSHFSKTWLICPICSLSLPASWRCYNELPCLESPLLL